MSTQGIKVITIIGLTIINLSGLALGENERFSNFYAAPGNLELIAMASEHSSHHQQRSQAHHHASSHHDSRQSPRSEYRGRSSASPAPPARKQPSTDFSSDEPRFSIGLGTLAPSYSQKFGVDGRTRLDFDHRSNGFSYSLTNNHHPEPQSDQSNYHGESPQDSKSVDGNVKIYYDQRFSPYAGAETNSYFTRLPFSGGSNSYGMKPLQEESNGPDKFQELFAKYAPRGGERESEYRDESGPSGGPPSSPFYSHGSDEGRSGGSEGNGEYQNGMYNSRYTEDGSGRKQPSNDFTGSYESGFMGPSSDDGEGSSEGYAYPLPFHKKDGSSFSSVGSDFNELGSHSGPEPVVFSSMIENYNGLDNNDAFSAYIEGLPLTP